MSVRPSYFFLRMGSREVSGREVREVMEKEGIGSITSEGN